MNIIYVGGAYSGNTEANVQLILEYLQHLWDNGEVGFSPVEAFHRPSMHAPTKDAKFWMQLCNKFLSVCTEVHLVIGEEGMHNNMSDRILNSVGSMAELGYANIYKMPVVYVVKRKDGSFGRVPELV